MFRQESESLIIQAEINGFDGMMIPFYVFVVAFYMIFITTFIFVDPTPGAGARFFSHLLSSMPPSCLASPTLS